MKIVNVMLPMRRTVVIPLGCPHFPLGDKDLLQRWVKEVEDEQQAVTVLCGDTFDFARGSYRGHIASYKKDNTSVLGIDEFHRGIVAEFAEILEPIKEKILGAILGNHYWEFSDGSNSEMELCRLLKIPYMGAVGIFRVQFVGSGQRTTQNTLIIYAHHSGGTTSARTTGGDIAGLERAALNFDADIYMLGHTHRRAAIKIPKLTVSRQGQPRIIEDTKILLRVGSLLKGYDDQGDVRNPSYAEVKALRPTDLGWTRVEITFPKLAYAGGGGKRAHERRMQVTY